MIRKEVRKFRRKKERLKTQNLANFFRTILSPSAYQDANKPIKFIIKDDDGETEHKATIFGVISLINSLAQLLYANQVNDSGEPDKVVENAQ